MSRCLFAPHTNDAVEDGWHLHWVCVAIRRTATNTVVDSTTSHRIDLYDRLSACAPSTSPLSFRYHKTVCYSWNQRCEFALQ